VFDPTRWQSISNGPGDAFNNSKLLAVFGSGPHACPGRRIAVAGEDLIDQPATRDSLPLEIKLIALAVISEFELSLPGGKPEVAEPLHLNLCPPTGTIRFSKVNC